jgi:hypothetical protein
MMIHPEKQKWPWVFQHHGHWNLTNNARATRQAPQASADNKFYWKQFACSCVNMKSMRKTNIDKTISLFRPLKHISDFRAEGPLRLPSDSSGAVN